MKISCIIIDDEPLARAGVKDYCEKVGFLDVVGEFKSATDAGAFLEEHPVNLMFLDINMPGVNGLDFVKSLRQPPLVIFTTAYREFASESYDLDALDYLVKPITFERFYKAVNKAYQYFDSATSSGLDHFYVKVDGVITKVNMEDVLYIEGMKDYIKIYLNDESRLITLLSLKQVEALLPSERFVRVHRSFIVSKSKVESIEGNIIHMAGQEIPIATNLRVEVLEQIVGDKFWKRG
ncbi:MAG: response regulator transcription factor [Roseivirga sp.]|nr:response regulator transcription factor [Roseivirga sp.]